jgi:hypothetical protein
MDYFLLLPFYFIIVIFILVFVFGNLEPRMKYKME